MTTSANVISVINISINDEIIRICLLFNKSLNHKLIGYKAKPA